MLRLSHWLIVVAVCVALVGLSAAAAWAAPDKQQKETSAKWMESFDLKGASLSSRGKNKFFILEPGYQLVLTGREGKRAVRLEVTVLDQTKRIGDVDTRIVEERETADGQLIEVSRNFFALSKKTNDVYYFGEEVDVYKDGKVVGHEGAWVAGSGGAKPGLMMPGTARVGAKYYQEVAPKVAMDRAEIVSADQTLKTPAGTFAKCLKTEETNPLEPGAKEYKVYAPGIGLIQDGGLLLTKHGFVKR